MKNVNYLLIIFGIIQVFIHSSYCDRRCGIKKYFNTEIYDCSNCSENCKECNGTMEGNCLECFDSMRHQLCEWQQGYYCLENCSKLLTFHESSIKLTTPNNVLLLNNNIVYVLLLLLLIVTIPFICIIIILIIIYKYNRPNSVLIRNFDVESKTTNAELKSMLKETMNNGQNEKLSCHGSHYTPSQKDAKACYAGSKKSKAEKFSFTIETQNTPEDPQKQSRSAQLPPQENLEELEHIFCDARMAMQENLVINSKLSVAAESFKTEQLEWDKKILINSGAFGNVYKCVYKDGDKCYHVAVKESRRQTNEPFKEERIMAQLKDHPHIIKLITTRIDESMLLVMPLLKSSLSQYLHSRQLTITQRIRYCQQIANGMSYLAFRQIVHCDLKASNVLVVDENMVQISDFGKSERIGDVNRSRRPITGTITHTAMELLDPLNKMLNCEATDVWSFGVTIWEIFNKEKKIPYADFVTPLTEINILNFLHEKNYLKTTYWPPKETSEALVSVESHMKRCLVHTQGSRPTFDKLWYWFSILLPEGQKLIQKEESTVTGTRNSRFLN